MRIAGLLVIVFLPAVALADGTTREVTNSLGIKLVRIESDQFVMGTASEPPASEAE